MTVFLICLLVILISPVIVYSQANTTTGTSFPILSLNTTGSNTPCLLFQFMALQIDTVRFRLPPLLLPPPRPNEF